MIEDLETLGKILNNFASDEAMKRKDSMNRSYSYTFSSTHRKSIELAKSTPADSDKYFSSLTGTT